MTDKTPAAPANNAIANAAFGLLIISSLLWLVGSFGYFWWSGLTIRWSIVFSPIIIVMMIQFFFVWIGAVIRKSVAEGLVLGLTQVAILKEMRANRINHERLN